MMHILSLIIRIELGIHHAEGDRCGNHTEGVHKGIIAISKSGKDIGHGLLGGENPSSSSEFIGTTLHIRQVVCRGFELNSFGVGKGNQQICDLGLALGGKHLFNGLPDFMGVDKTMHMWKDLEGEGLKQVWQNLLVAS